MPKKADPMKTAKTTKKTRKSEAVELRPSEAASAPWTFLTNHTHVLLCIVSDPAVRLRDVAEQVGVTERAVQRIVAELEQAGYLRREKEGRCNRYEVDLAVRLRHPLEEHCPVSDLIKMVLGSAAAAVRGKVS